MNFVTSVISLVAALIGLGSSTSSGVSSSTHPEPSVILRPNIGYGYAGLSESADEEYLKLFGLRLMRDTGRNQRFGFDITQYHFDDSNKDNANAAGLVFEQMLPKGFHLSVGTMAHINYNDEDETLFGLMTNIGWEQVKNETYRTYIAYQNDAIFSSEDDVIHSVKVGLSIKF